MFQRFALIAAATWAMSTTVAHACGSDSDCMIGERSYRIRLPDNVPDGKLGAIVFSHGYKGTAKGVMNNPRFTALANELGVAIIATKSAKNDWSIPGAPSSETDPTVDELAYYDAVLADVSARFPIDSNRLMASGFSAGAMMVWNLACHRSSQFAGFAPIAGTFWQPAPTHCDAPPTSVIHMHGTSDKIVPLEGRKVLDTHQGSVPDVLAMYGQYGGFSQAEARKLGGLSCDIQSNEAADVLAFCAFEGGHSFQMEYLKSAWSLLEERGKL
ncbi:alpha/beta hydrolase family esterase [Tritonibacter aquimaris]|nr:PHB depolymerase family esterase [Tritonibacter aquimaris]